ncbi:MAG: PDZ domain-containing protein [Bdellovibrionaceae bacterium]|nr:PDZ domain-containing protein [Bdellovibrio sp.]
MKSWGAVLVTAMGFLVGMILAGVGGLSAKTSFSTANEIIQQKKIESYWSESDLGKDELFEVISNSNCQSSEKYFLACINSVIQTADDFDLELVPATGRLEKTNFQALDQTEQNRLLPFATIYAKQLHQLINFENLWGQLLDLMPNEKKATLIANGINGFLSIYKDPHTYILPNNYYEEIGSKLERSNLFVGIALERNQRQIRIRKIFLHSDADVAGLKPQDVILNLEDHDVTTMTLQEVMQVLKDANKKSFEFKIQRNGETMAVKVARRFQSLNHVQFDVLNGIRNYALVTITKFNRGVCEEVSNKIRAAADKNIVGLVLDLRDNPGGQLDEAACLAGLFVGINKKIYSVEYFDPVKSNEVVLTTGSLLYTGPLLVLVNSSSASASELLAGALQEYKRAIVIGEKTFGKGTFQESEIWSKNNRITMFKTQGYYLLPSQLSTQIVGVTPDIELTEPHLQIREENNYFNPVHNPKARAGVARHSVYFEENLKKCSANKNSFQSDDIILKKALEVLACRQLTSTLATQFNIEDFN